MLKCFWRLGVGLASVLSVLVLSSNASAISPNVVIAQIQTGGATAATQEFISMYNNSSAAVDVTNWCLVYSSSSDATQTTIGCLGSIDTEVDMSAHSYITAATSKYVVANPGFTPTITVSSGLASAGGHIKLLDANKNEVDRLGYGTATNPETTAAVAPGPGRTLERLDPNFPILKETDNNAADFAVDICQNIEGVQAIIPPGYENADGLGCTLIPALEDATLLITELLPNAVSTDTGNEFIEVYNPNARAVNLKNYRLELGPSFTKSFVLPDQLLASGGYASFSDTQTGIVLPNTSATLRLIAPAGNIVDMTATYDAPTDNMAWAIIGETWQYTNQPTPGAANLVSIEPGVGGGTDSPDELEPCPAGKFRNPDTNRCKNIEDGEGSLTPCAADQVRNPETNRCRSVLTTGSNLTPCQPGQERNPETNRCRATASTASATLKPCAANQERNPETNRCRNKASSVAAGKVKDIAAEQIGGSHNGWLLTGGVVAAAAGYGVWEWRSEVAAFGRRLKGIFGKSPPTD